MSGGTVMSDAELRAFQVLASELQVRRSVGVSTKELREASAALAAAGLLVDDDTARLRKILGWEWKFIEGRRWLCPPKSASTSVAAASPEAAEITVDDLLQWLDCHASHWKAYPAIERRFVHVTGRDGYSTTHGGYTLHEALTAAVLAVAEREEPGDE